jgi:hypothetical protein
MNIDDNSDLDNVDNVDNGKLRQSLIEYNVPFFENILPEDVLGTIKIYYRAIRGRPVELLKCIHMPKGYIGLCKYLRFDERYDMRFYEQVTNLTPEVQDLRKSMNSMKLSETEELEYKKEIYNYVIFSAIYNRSTDTIVEMYFGEFDCDRRRLLEYNIDRLEHIKGELVYQLHKINPYSI